MARKYRDKSLYDHILAKKIAADSIQRRFYYWFFCANGAICLRYKIKNDSM